MSTKLISLGILSLLFIAFGTASARAGILIDDKVTPETRKQLLEDFDFARSILGKSASPLHQQVFGEMDGKAYPLFLEARVKQIKMDFDDASPTTIAYVSPIFDDPGNVWLTQNYVKFDIPQLLRLSIVLHEARHTETDNGNWPHATCPNPFIGEDGKPVLGKLSGKPMAGLPACDSKALGSYGIQTVFLKNIEKFCAGCTDKVRMDGAVYGDDMFKRMLGEAKETIRHDLY